MASSRSRRKNNLGTYVSDIEQRIRLIETPIQTNIEMLGGEIGASALAEEITLQNSTIQSANFTEGLSGWRISSSGDAEFGNVVVRGEINAETGTIGQWTLSSPVVTRRGLLAGTADAVGTFIENINSEHDDAGETSGVYISLFCSEDLATAGLYLNDYGDNSFDRAYFSSEGVYFSSPSYVNLILNPNFEISTGNSLINWSLVSSTGYTGPTATNISGTVSNITFSYQSLWGSRITWTAAPATWSYYRANVDFSAYELAGYQNKTLAISFDLFPFYEPVAKTVTALSGNATTLTITSTAHGFAAGDYIFFDFFAYDSDTEPVDFAYNWLHNHRSHEVLTTAANSFTVANNWGSAPTGAIALSGISSGTVRAYKAPYLVFDANDIRFVFGAGSPVPLANVLTSEANAVFSDTRYNYDYAPDVLIESFLYQPNFAFQPKYEIDGGLLNAAYLAQDPTGYANQNNFYLDIPAYWLKANINGTPTATKITSGTAIGFVIDYVKLLPSLAAGVFIDGNSTNAYWADGEANSPSYSGTLEWINIDLTTGSSVLQELSYATFYNPTTVSLDVSPYVYSTSSPPIRGDIDGTSTDTSTMALSSGIYNSPISATEYVNKFSTITASVDAKDAGIELYAASAKALIADDSITGYGQASLQLWVESDRTSNVIIKATTFVASNLSGAPLLKSDYTYGTGTSATNAFYVRWRDTTTDTTTTSASYEETASQCRCRFIAPPSGIVNITIGGQIENDAAGTAGRLSFQLYDITAGTVLVVDGNDRWSIGKEGTLWIQSSYNRIVGDLDPYSTYEVRAVVRRGAGAGTVTIARRAITVVPIT